MYSQAGLSNSTLVTLVRLIWNSNSKYTNQNLSTRYLREIIILEDIPVTMVIEVQIPIAPIEWISAVTIDSTKSILQVPLTMEKKATLYDVIIETKSQKI